jgi:hypothetical protein
MSVKSYRYYCLDGAGKLHSAEWFDADGDEAAIAAVEAKHPGAVCEIWQRNRLVGKMVPDRLRA